MTDQPSYTRKTSPATISAGHFAIDLDGHIHGFFPRIRDRLIERGTLPTGVTGRQQSPQSRSAPSRGRMPASIPYGTFARSHASAHDNTCALPRRLIIAISHNSIVVPARMPKQRLTRVDSAGTVGPSVNIAESS
jgi:hypothetical protein